MTEPSTENGVIVEDAKGSHLKFPLANRYEVHSGFLYLYRGRDELLAIYAPEQWRNVVKFGVAEKLPERSRVI